MLTTLIRTARIRIGGTRPMGALLERGSPKMAHPSLDTLGLHTAGAGRSVGAGGNVHGIKMASAVTNIIELTRWDMHPILDQGGQNSCVANALMRAEKSTLLSRYNLVDTQVPLGSRDYVYYWARTPFGKVSDTGCFPSVALAMLAKYGVPPETSWPYSDARVNTRPGTSARWDGSDRRGVRGTYMIPDDASDRLQQIRAAHDSGRSVTMTLPIWNGFSSSFSVFRWATRGDTFRGYHHLECVGTFECENQVWGICPNSYGYDSHTNGVFVVDERYLLEQASSLCVVDPEEPCR